MELLLFLKNQASILGYSIDHEGNLIGTKKATNLKVPFQIHQEGESDGLQDSFLV